MGIGLDEDTPDHTTISRTRRLIDVETHSEVFGWVLGVLADRGLVQEGEADRDRCNDVGGERAMRSVYRRDTGRAMRSFCVVWRRLRA